MPPAELETHFILNSERCGTHPKDKAATRDYMEQVRQKSDPMELDETAYPVWRKGRSGQERKGK